MAQINKPTDYFNTVLYTGDGANSRAITGVGHQPDLVWFKNRTGATAYHHQLHDSVRGATQGALYSSLDNGEDTSYGISSFDSDGFTLRNPSHDSQNASGYTFASWNWLSGGTASSNTDGSITSSVSANTTSGFSIVSYTGNGTSGATVGHGLGVVPSMIIVKKRDSQNNWGVYHQGIGNGNALYLDTTSATVDSTAFWNDTTPTSTVFSLGDSATVNGSGGSYIAYCFSEVKGFSKFSSYVGNGSSSGSFIYTGFKPSWVMFKSSSTTGGWEIHDNKRDTFNPSDKRLFPNLNNVEASEDYVDFLSNGFKFRTTDANGNTSGTSYIYMCFAESPLVGTNNIPATAR